MTDQTLKDLCHIRNTATHSVVILHTLHLQTPPQHPHTNDILDAANLLDAARNRLDQILDREQTLPPNKRLNL